MQFKLAQIWRDEGNRDAATEETASVVDVSNGRGGNLAFQPLYLRKEHEIEGEERRHDQTVM